MKRRSGSLNGAGRSRARPVVGLEVAIHRHRKRYRELFRQKIADTVADPVEVESKLRFLAAVLTKKYQPKPVSHGP